MAKNKTQPRARDNSVQIYLSDTELNLLVTLAEKRGESRTLALRQALMYLCDKEGILIEQSA